MLNTHRRKAESEDAMFHTSEDLASYYAALSLPKSVVSEYQKLLQKWITNHGVPWTVDRCKTIYTDYVRFRAGLPLVGTWYSKNHLGLPKGVISHIFKLSITRKRQRFSCGVLLRAYTRFISDEPTEKQLSKFLQGVTSEDVVIPDSIRKGVVDGIPHIGGPFVVERLQPSYISYVPSPSRRVPLYNGKTAAEDTHWFTQWETIQYTPTGRYLENKYHPIFSKVFAGFIRFSQGDCWPPQSTVDAVGKIGLIQEPGFKLRAVANPNRVYQIALKPLGDAVYKAVQQLPWDCTFDQSKAIPVIQQHLQAKSRCHCIDLSGATDYFPLSLQLDLLHVLFPNMKDYVDLFEELSRSNWVMGDTTIKWTKGQPLGLYPSFGSFALTHGMLLYYLNSYSHNNEFYVLGDDVVILNDGLALKYLETLKILGCPVSESKSITSQYIAEFGGKLISKEFVEPQLKWRQMSDDNFIDVLRLLGLRAMRLLRPQQRKVARAIYDIPDFMGGVGLNPDGIPLQDRIEKYLTLFGEDVSTFLMSYDRKFNQFFNEQVKNADNRISSQQWDGSRLPDLDQKSAALVSKYLPLFAEMYGVMGTNLYSVVPQNQRVALPIDGFTGTRITLLELLQRKLSF
jgi:hypothetical protein